MDSPTMIILYCKAYNVITIAYGTRHGELATSYLPRLWQNYFAVSDKDFNLDVSLRNSWNYIDR